MGCISCKIILKKTFQQKNNLLITKIIKVNRFLNKIKIKIMIRILIKISKTSNNKLKFKINLQIIYLHLIKLKNFNKTNNKITIKINNNIPKILITCPTLIRLMLVILKTNRLIIPRSRAKIIIQIFNRAKIMAIISLIIHKALKKNLSISKINNKILHRNTF
jgi:hypothetical protein